MKSFSSFEIVRAVAAGILVYGCGIFPAMAQEPAFKIEANNIDVKKGRLLVAVCLEKEFLRGKCTYSTVVDATSDPQQVLIPKLPPGIYAVKVGHDKNSNTKIDTNFFGAPSEPIGFSKNKVGKYGPPDFKDVSVEYKGVPVELSIDLR